MDEKFLSVIIPAYNPDISMFRKCVDSVLKITLPMEVLVIDDGSKAEYAGPCSEYAKKDPRIRWFSKENGGVSSARNYGIQRAEGKYLLFVDADDEITDALAQFLHDYSEKLNADWVLFDMISRDIKSGQSHCGKLFNVNGLRARTTPIVGIEYADLLDRRVTSRELSGSWSKLISRRLVIEKGIVFPVGVLSGEDSMFNTRLLYHIRTVQYVPIGAYIYNYSPRMGGRLLSGPYKRYEFFTLGITELEALINFRAEPEKKAEYIQQTRAQYIEFMVQDCFILHQAGKLDQAMKNFLLGWVWDNKLLDGVSLSACAGMKKKIYYLIVKYKMWPIVDLAAAIKQFLQR